ncbi:MAG: hypothetical protein LC112_10695 [Flavobacteriales bacterium]|nr:hypothetical protein [Flavobacteriales bacterium]
MKTQKSNTITIEVLKPIFTDTDKPFLAGDWIKAEKVSKIENEGRYYIQKKGSKTGVFMVLNSNVEISKKHTVYKLQSISRFL